MSFTFQFGFTSITNYNVSCFTEWRYNNSKKHNMHCKLNAVQKTYNNITLVNTYGLLPTYVRRVKNKKKNIFITYVFFFTSNRKLWHIFYPIPIHIYPIFTITLVVGLLVALIIKFTFLEENQLTYYENIQDWYCSFWKMTCTRYVALDFYTWRRLKFQRVKLRHPFK